MDPHKYNKQQTNQAKIRQAMGAYIARMFTGASEKRILVLGLDGAGKTTLLYKLHLGKVVATMPTIGFNVETVQYDNRLKFTVWDIGGQDKIRPLWKLHFVNTDAVIFVVDSTDTPRFSEASEELRWIMSCEELAGVPLLVLANKCDMASSHSANRVAVALDMHKLDLDSRTDTPAKVSTKHKWHIQECSALRGCGVDDGLRWLARHLA
ncbi:ADP-ribosylation factor 3 [Pelomyxa schiedti]|nr:ADP-ribosylation factor 3 [Pelomyxa schiedti]